MARAMLHSVSPGRTTYGVAATGWARAMGGSDEVRGPGPNAPTTARPRASAPITARTVTENATMAATWRRRRRTSDRTLRRGGTMRSAGRDSERDGRDGRGSRGSDQSLVVG